MFYETWYLVIWYVVIKFFKKSSASKLRIETETRLSFKTTEETHPTQCNCPNTIVWQKPAMTTWKLILRYGYLEVFSPSTVFVPHSMHTSVPGWISIWNGASDNADLYEQNIWTCAESWSVPHHDEAAFLNWAGTELLSTFDYSSGKWNFVSAASIHFYDFIIWPQSFRTSGFVLRQFILLW